MKIAYVNSICQRYDAISNAIKDEIGWLIAAGHEVRLFAFACEFNDVPHTIVNGESDIAFDPFFQRCDLALFHFGVYYSLFNLLPAVPQRAQRVVIFHNITPKEVLPHTSHKLIDLSFAQVSNIAFADYVICDSQTNFDVLRAAGVTIPATVLPLAVHSLLRAPAVKPSFGDGVPRVVFVGRLVASKGPLDLLLAVGAILETQSSLRLRLDLIANLNFSNAEVADAVRQQVDALHLRFGARISAALHANATEERKHEILHDADLFVLPTKHEGFCVPVLEALASGCKVICYDNSNLPAICGGLASLVPTGDIAGLAKAIQADLATVQDASWQTAGAYAVATAAAATHLSQFSTSEVRRRFLAFVRRHGRRTHTDHYA